MTTRIGILYGYDTCRDVTGQDETDIIDQIKRVGSRCCGSACA